RASRGGGGPELAAAQAGGAPAASPGGTERTTTTTSTEVSKPGPTEHSVGPGFFVPRRISRRVPVRCWGSTGARAPSYHQSSTTTRRRSGIADTCALTE